MFAFTNRFKGDQLLTNTLYKQLYSQVTDGYNLNVIPIKKMNSTIVITIDFTLLQLINMVIYKFNYFKFIFQFDLLMI